MKRTGMLSGLLVLMLATGVMAQEPSHSPVYAPDDLVYVLEDVNPRGGDWSVSGGGGVVMEDLLGLDAVLQLIDAVGEDPNDIRFAIGQTINQPLDDMLNLYVMAVRVVGTPAHILVGPMVRILSGTPLDAWPPETGVAWRDFDGRDVLVLLDEVQPDDWDDYGAGQQRWLALYPVGEVLFIGYKDGVVPLTIGEVLARLP
jgi:hypothetical protein